MKTQTSLFWRDLEADLENPKARAEFLRQSRRIATIDTMVNALDAARIARHMTKADLARAIDANPAAIRRLFAAQGNPTLGTLTDVAAALGFEVTLVPRDADKELPGRRSPAGRTA